jgi:cell division protein FtsB
MKKREVKKRKGERMGYLKEDTKKKLGFSSYSCIIYNILS